MALGPRLDLRQSQSLVMTPQLQQAIKLLALSNLEIESFVADALESNPLLEAGDLRREAESPDQSADFGSDFGSDPANAPSADVALAPSASSSAISSTSSPSIGEADSAVEGGEERGRDVGGDGLAGEGADSYDWSAGEAASDGQMLDMNALDIDRSALDIDRDTGDGAALPDTQLSAPIGTQERVDAGDWSEAAGSASGAGAGAASGGNAADDMEAFLENQAGPDPSLFDHLSAQLGMACDDQGAYFIALHITGLLDETGYLRFDLREIAQDLGVALSAVEAALQIVQTLDPTGIGARDLSECLALQAREADRYDPAMARLIENLDLLAKGEFPRLQRMCAVDAEDFADMLGELRALNPKPGLAFGGSTQGAIIPDVLIKRGRGIVPRGDKKQPPGAGENRDESARATGTEIGTEIGAESGAESEKSNGLNNTKTSDWDISLNEASLPRLMVNRAYFVQLSDGKPSKETRHWLGEKLADANWLIKALDQRQKTILKVAAAIVAKQDGFFHHGVSGLRPLTLREVAEEIEMHESTVSRVTSNKYLHCDRGMFELKYFFMSGVGGRGGAGHNGGGAAATGGDGDAGAAGAGTAGGGASSEAVKARIKALIDAEEAKKILSDDKLVEMLKAEGFDLARRTVAKYREAIGIGSSVQRRRAKKLQAF